MTYPYTLHPDHDELYQHLLPVYRMLDRDLSVKVVRSFRLLWEGAMSGGTFTAGIAMERSLIGHGVILAKGDLDDAEYNEILAAQEVMENLLI